MNKKGFTLVELLVVIMILGLIFGIAIPNIYDASNRTKIKTLSAKIKNIEKSAILYAQDEIDDFSETCTINDNSFVCIEISVQDLVNSKYFDSNNITNPVNNESLINCKIQIYKKYNKIYAKYIKDDTNGCWK